MDHALWATTSYFNPLHYENRRKNYKIFRDRLRSPLVTVELSVDGIFELTKDDADILVQITGNGRQSILFQKERLLNIAVRNVPSGVAHIAWLDCDIVLRPDWVRETVEILKKVPVCQLFERVMYMNQDQLPEDIAPGDPVRINCSFVRGRLPSVNWQGNPGLAWAARKSLFESMGGLYEAMVLGGGDSAFAAALCSGTDQKIKGWENYYSQLSPAHQKHYDGWASIVAREVGAEMGILPGYIYHLWHGSREDRQYMTRYVGFNHFNFDPAVDLVNGEWAPHRQDLQEMARKYFEGRREDG